MHKPIPSDLALCEKLLIDDAEEEATLLAQRRQFCRVLVPTSEQNRDDSRQLMDNTYKAAHECWETAATDCPQDFKRSEAKLAFRSLKVSQELHSKEIDTIPKPKRGLAREDKEDSTEAVSGGKRKRQNTGRAWVPLWDPLTDPYKEDIPFSTEYCQKQLEYDQFYLKSLRYKIQACNETRAYFDCQKDAYVRFTGSYQAALDGCHNFTCE